MSVNRWRVSRHAAGSCALAGLLAIAGCSRESVESLETTASVPVAVELAQVATFVRAVEASGQVTPAPGAELTVVAPAQARVAELPKAEGDRVASGDLLVRFDIPGFASDLASRRAAVAQANARLDNARANFTRLSALLAQGVAAQRDVDDARRQQTEAEADLDQARSAADAAAAVLDRAVVRAPFSGVIARRFHNPGDLVDAAAGDPVLKVINPAALQVTAAVATADLPRIAVGRRATIAVPGSDAMLEGRVVATAAEVDPSGATANVRLAFAVPAHLAAGTPVHVRIIVEERPNALVIPASALFAEDDKTFVMVADRENRAHRSPVAAGTASGGLVEIATGLKAGDRVIVRGQDGLPDGTLVTIAP